MAATQTTIDEVLETFQLFDDWEDRYRYIIDLGRKLPELPEQYHTETYKVRGCASQVWFHIRESGDSPPRLILEGDSDAMIVKGLMAILFLIYSGRTAREILETDARPFLDQLDLTQHLSPMRTNGLFSMMGRIGELAAAAAA
jgi:cysteine desulfuration protein SufE